VIFGNRTGGGTTEETFLADLTLGLGVRKVRLTGDGRKFESRLKCFLMTGFQIKAGAPAREKATVYNRLLRIDRELGEKAIYAG
jgi:enolase